jgi:hypothetical protein
MKMVKAYILIFSIVLIITPVASHSFDEWSKRDIALESAWITLNIIDWSQTRYISKHPEFYESNPILGRHPSISAVDTYFAAGTLLHIGVTHILPSKYRPYWQMITIMGSGACVINNNRIGVGLNFSF